MEAQTAEITKFEKKSSKNYSEIDLNLNYDL
jgi:hypothetical protein